MTGVDRIVIVGAGQAAAQAIETLRRRGFNGSICLVGDEPHLPYQRPQLSKKYLAGTFKRDRLLIRHHSYYAERAIETRLGRRAVAIEAREQRVQLDDGTALRYDALLIATGSRPQRLSIPGADLEGVHYVRTVADVDALRAACARARRLVVVGAGYVGLEVAATCRQLGLDVTVLEMAERAMMRVVCTEISSFYEAEHARHGVRILCNARVRAFDGYGRIRHVRSVLCEDGSEHPADLVVIGIGVVPAEELAGRAGLECSNGIVVDEFCRTSNEAIYAAGDCTNHPSVCFGGRVRLESVDNAVEQGASAACSIMGEPAAHDKVPWFWSDQFDLKLIIVGLSAGHDRVVARGNTAGRSFSACYLRGGELIAVDTVNNQKDQMAARKLVGARVRPNPQRLADPTFPLKDCI